MRSFAILLTALSCSISTATLSLAPASAVGLAAIPRGGGWFSYSWGGVQDRYRKVLEDQIVALERQVRVAKEEAKQLRKLLKLGAARKGAGSSIKTEIAILQKQLSQLQAFQVELEGLLKDEQSRSAELEKNLANAQGNTSEIREQHARELEALEKVLLEKSKQQLDNLQELMEQRIKEAAERARREALADVETRIKDAVNKIEQKALKELEEERKKAAEAVEKERSKMRKLVKALAEREKKVEGTKILSSPVSSRKQQTINPTTVRNPLK